MVFHSPCTGRGAVVVHTPGAVSRRCSSRLPPPFHASTLIQSAPSAPAGGWMRTVGSTSRWGAGRASARVTSARNTGPGSVRSAKASTAIAPRAGGRCEPPRCSVWVAEIGIERARDRRPAQAAGEPRERADGRDLGQEGRGPRNRHRQVAPAPFGGQPDRPREQSGDGAEGERPVARDAEGDELDEGRLREVEREAHRRVAEDGADDERDQRVDDEVEGGGLESAEATEPQARPPPRARS